MIAFKDLCINWPFLKCFNVNLGHLNLKNMLSVGDGERVKPNVHYIKDVTYY